MNLQLPLTPEVEAKLRAEASAAGQDIESFVVHVLTDRLGDPAPDRNAATPRTTADRLAFLEAIAARHPERSQLADASRETIYADRGR